MVIINKSHVFATILIIIICAGLFILFSGSQNSGISAQSYDTPFGIVSINAKIPESPSSITLYQVVPSENDMAFYSTGKFVKVRPNVTSETEAPQVAQTVLIPYGGLPEGAKLVYVKTEYIETKNIETHQVTAKDPISTNVQYNRYIDDKPVVGDGGFIYLNLGNNGELLYLNKIWRNISVSGSVPIISASEAIEKIKLGELLGHRPKCACQLNVDKIGLGYYEKGRDETQEYLEPVWIFSGTLSSGDPWKYFVYARESAESTMIIAPNQVQVQQDNKTPDTDPTVRLSVQIESTTIPVKTGNISE